MVLKRSVRISLNKSKFENDVKMYGTQTPQKKSWEATRFENDVKMYGTQTTKWQTTA